MSGQGQTLPAAKPCTHHMLDGVSATLRGAGRAFQRPGFKGKLCTQWVSFGNDLMNRRHTGQPLSVSLVRYERECLEPTWKVRAAFPTRCPS